MIEDITNAKAEERSNMKLDELSFITDKCISALFIELFPEKDVKQKESIEILLTQFPNLSKAIITNVYKNTKFELKENKEDENKLDKETEEAAEYIFEEEIESKTIEEVKVDEPSMVQVVEESKDIKVER